MDRTSASSGGGSQSENDRNILTWQAKVPLHAGPSAEEVSRATRTTTSTKAAEETSQLTKQSTAGSSSAAPNTAADEIATIITESGFGTRDFSELEHDALINRIAENSVALAIKMTKKQMPQRKDTKR